MMKQRKPMFDAPRNIQRTRNNKYTIEVDCQHLVQYANNMLRRLEFIPEEDDDKHADMVAELAEKVHRALIDFQMADRVGKI